MNRRLLNERNKLLYYESQKLISVIVDENLEENTDKYFKFRIYVKYNHKFITVENLYKTTMEKCICTMQRDEYTDIYGPKNILFIRLNKQIHTLPINTLQDSCMTQFLGVRNN